MDATYIYHVLNEKGVPKAYPEETARLVLHLVKASYDPWDDSELEIIIDEVAKQPESKNIMHEILNYIAGKGSNLPERYA